MSGPATPGTGTCVARVACRRWRRGVVTIADVGSLVAIEGLDGSGKRTLTESLVARFTGAGARVATLAFPRYGESDAADIAAEALHGEHGDLRTSVNAMALLFAIDRRDAAADIRGLLATHDLVLLDRYVASNAAYSAARLDVGADSEIVDWIGELEFHRFGVPVPDHQLLLDVGAEVAGVRASGRAQADPTRARDHYERDDSLQRRTFAVYEGLAARGWMSPWSVVDADTAAEAVTAVLD